MFRIAPATVSALLVLTLLDASSALAAEIEDPNQFLWKATTGHCEMNVNGSETLDEIQSRMLECFNDGQPRGCTEPDPPHNNLVDDFIPGASVGPYPVASTQGEWGYDKQLICASNPTQDLWVYWHRPQCWDADELGVNENGGLGTCPVRDNVDRFDRYTGTTCDPKDGNPCDAGSGNKTIQESDFTGVGLDFYRTWHSMAPKNLTQLGSRWMHSYGDFLDLDEQATPIGIVTPKGVYEPLNSTTGNVYIGTEINGIRVHQSGTEYVAEFMSGERRYYDGTGRLDRVESSPGQFTTISYNGPDGEIDEIVGQFGHKIRFTYSASNGKIQYIYLPDDKSLLIAHGALTNGNYPVVYVKKPYNRYVDYLYEDPIHPDLITGIENENNTRHSTYAYDSSGRAISTELAGAANKFTFDYNTDTTVVTDGDGRVKTYTFENSPFAGRRHVSTARNGVTSSRAYADAATDPTLRRLETRTDELGNVTQYGYDDHHRTSITRAFGTSLAHTTTYEYLRADSNKVTKVSRPSAHSANDAETTITYSSLDLPLTVTEAGYDSAGQPISRTTTFTYNSYGQVTSIDGPRTDVSDVTTLTYYDCSTGNECGQLEAVTNALGHTTTFDTYDANGRVTKETGPNGYVKEYTYDTNYRWLKSVKITSPTGYSYTYWYTWHTMGGLLTSAPTGPYMKTIKYTYDNAHRLIEVKENSTGAKIKYEYDSAGNVTEENTEDPSGTVKRLVNYTYDDFSRLDTISNAGAITDVLFDAIGNLDETEDPLFNVTDHIYDALNRLTETVDADNNSTLMAYDVHNWATSVTAPNGVTTTYIYDDLGNLESEVSQDRGTTSYTYDSAGNVLTVTDGRSITAAYAYDALNRVTSISYPTTSKDVTFGYDSGTYNKGLLTSMTDESGSTTWDHYVPGPLSYQRTIERTQVTNGQSLTTKWVVHSLTRQPYSTIYPSGTTLTHTLSAGHTTKLKFGTSTVVQYVKYDPFGPPNQWRWGNYAYADFIYNQRGELTSAPMGTGTRSLGYDVAGRITTQSDSEYAMTYGYDNLARVNDFTATPLNGGTLVPGSQQFTYDENGNRESITENSTFFDYSIATSSNRLLSTAGPAAKSFTYDLSGNVTADGQHTYVYDDRGRLESIDSGAATYEYNGLGQRVQKTVGGTTTLFVYGENGELLGEYDGSGNVLQENIWLNGRLVGTKQGTKVYYVHTDHVGTPRAIADGNTIVWRWDSDPFGATAPDEDPDGNSTAFGFNLRFPGQYYDSESSSHYNYFRTYDPSTGRYLESDPIGLRGGLNTYGYVGGNPLSAIDPFGLDLVLVGEPGGLGRMLNLAAQTWDAENCGCNEIVEVGSGDEAIAAIESYAERNGGIDGLRVFAHSGPNGIFFDQSPAYASLYSRGAGRALSYLPFNDAARIQQIDPSLFLEGAEIDLRGCKAGQGENSFAQALANHLGRNVLGSEVGTQFSAVKNGRPNEGLPKNVPSDFQPIYMVPDIPGKGFKTYEPQK